MRETRYYVTALTDDGSCSNHSKSSSREDAARAQRATNKESLRLAMLSSSKTIIRNEAAAVGVDPKKYKDFHDLAQAIADAAYPNLSDNPND